MKAVLMPVTGKAALSLQEVLNKPSIGKELSNQQRQLISEKVLESYKNARKFKVNKVK